MKNIATYAISIFVAVFLIHSSATAASKMIRLVQLETDHGCLFFWDPGPSFTEPEYREELKSNNIVFRWSSACTPGQIISGKGTLSEEFGGRPSWKTTYSGEVVDGVFDGPIEHQVGGSVQHFTFHTGCMQQTEYEIKKFGLRVCHRPPFSKFSKASAGANASANKSPTSANGQSPRQVSIKPESVFGCPVVIVTSKQPGRTPYNTKYPWTIVEVEYSWDAPRTGGQNRGGRTEAFGVLIDTLDAAPPEFVPVVAASAADNFDCRKDKWSARVIRWRDNDTQLSPF